MLDDPAIVEEFLKYIDIRRRPRVPRRQYAELRAMVDSKRGPWETWT
jgi:hypothetical protein